jgi:hypothetical protein
VARGEKHVSDLIVGDCAEHDFGTGDGMFVVVGNDINSEDSSRNTRLISLLRPGGKVAVVIRNRASLIKFTHEPIAAGHPMWPVLSSAMAITARFESGGFENVNESERADLQRLLHAVKGYLGT